MLFGKDRKEAKFENKFSNPPFVASVPRQAAAKGTFRQKEMVINMEKANKKYITDFTKAPIAPALLRFSLPLLLASLLQVFYNMVDMIVVGHALGKEGLSAVSVGGDVANLLTFIAMGFAGAAQVLISQHVGAGRKKVIGSFIGTVLSFCTACALFLSVLFLFVREPVLRLMNTTR